ncbi:IS1 family transposase [Escherichia coli]
MASVSISCPSCSATDGVVRNGKSTAGHQRYLSLWALASTRFYVT